MQPITEFPARPVWRDPRAIALMMAASLTVMTAATISPALPGLEKQFGNSDMAAFLVRLLVPAPSLAVILSAPLCGIVADRAGRRRMLITGIILFILAGTAGLLLPTLTSILVSRICLGTALAMIMTAQSALLGDYFSGPALHAVSGGQVFARNIGGFVFISLAGALAVINPRLPFAVYALPALALPFFLRAIVEPARNATHTDSTASGSERLPRVVLLLSFGQMVVTMLFFVMPTQLPFLLTERGYTSPAMTGAALGVLMLAGGAAALFYPRIQAAVGNGGNWACGFGLMAVGFALLAMFRVETAVFLGCAAIGAGYALAIPGFVALSLAVTPAGRRGKAGALLTGSVFLGQFLSPFFSNPSIMGWGWNNSLWSLTAMLGMAALVSAVTAGRPFNQTRRGE